MLEGGNAALVSLQAGNFVPVPFSELYDPQTGRTRVRLVDVHSTRYAIAHRYMIRLRREDFHDEAVIGRIAQVAHLSVPQFRAQFEYLLENEPPAIVLQQQGH
jgi:AraC-like DNA-binding protein